MKKTQRRTTSIGFAIATALAIAACFDATTNTTGPDAGHDASLADAAAVDGAHDASTADTAASDTAAADTAAPDTADACPSYAPLTMDASAPSPSEDGGMLPGPPAVQCSAGGTVTATTINWTNNACSPIEAWWVDFNCIEVYYNDVPAMGMVAQPTFVGHRWRLRAKGTGLLLKEVDPNVDANPRTVVFP